MDFAADAIKHMAQLLAKYVPELKNDDDCRAWLESAGFADWTIHQYLNDARDLARTLRGQEADRLSEQSLRGK